eukprot:5672199-Pleurochrysis_carterae.AAC.2
MQTFERESARMRTFEGLSASRGTSRTSASPAKQHIHSLPPDDMGAATRKRSDTCAKSARANFLKEGRLQNQVNFNSRVPSRGHPQIPRMGIR